MKWKEVLRKGKYALLQSESDAEYVVASGYDPTQPENEQWDHGTYFTYWNNIERKPAALQRALDFFRSRTDDENFVDKGEKYLEIYRSDYMKGTFMEIWQSHIDASISSTVNVPNDFTVENVEDLYMSAWENGLKGVTIFRDGCKRAGILTTKKDPDKKDENDKKDGFYNLDSLPRGTVIKADDNCIGKKRTLHTGCGTLHCEAFFDPDTGDLLETYFSKGSSGGCNNFMIGLSRTISLAARGGISIYDIVDQLKSSGACPSYAVRSATKHDTSKGSCCPVAIGNALIDMYNELHKELFDDEIDECVDSDSPDKKVKIVKSKSQKVSKNPCPQCGEELTFEGGCNICKSCGWSKCD